VIFTAFPGSIFHAKQYTQALLYSFANILHSGYHEQKHQENQLNNFMHLTEKKRKKTVSDKQSTVYISGAV